MFQNEVITHEAGNDEAWVCICGNKPSDDGFFPCNEEGNEMEPTTGWPGRYVCARCGRIIDPESLKVVGLNARPKLLA
jgi:hypothetical protein